MAFWHSANEIFDEVAGMRKLLSANFSRLLRSRFFWLITGILCCWGGIVYIMMYINITKLGYTNTEANVYFFNGNLCLGPALAIFTSFFIGTEYSDGGFRNKISVGHRRLPIYLSNLILCSIAGILFLAAFWIGALTVGLPTLGAEILLQLEKPFIGFLYSCIAVVTYAALFCMISMLDSNKARTAVIGLLIAVFLIMGGFATSNGLAHPEFTTRMSMNAEGAYEIMENIPNSKYLSGTRRIVYQCVDALLPSCHALRPIMTNADYPAYIPFCALVWITVLTSCGFVLFRRKDIK